MTRHSLKAWMPYFQDILDGKKTFEFRKNDCNYSVGDEVILREYDSEKDEFTDRQIFGKITYLIAGSSFGIPEGYCVFGFHTTRQEDFIRDYELISNKVLPRYEEKISHRVAGNLIDRIDHVLSEYNSVATNSIWKAKQFIEDVKTQFKALELVVEGITGHGNHTEKRVIANHVIVMLRSMVDRIDRIDWEYSTGIFERYNFFRSQSPERNLMEKYQDIKRELESLKSARKSEDKGEELPF